MELRNCLSFETAAGGIEPPSPRLTVQRSTARPTIDREEEEEEEEEGEEEGEEEEEEDDDEFDFDNLSKNYGE